MFLQNLTQPTAGSAPLLDGIPEVVLFRLAVNLLTVAVLIRLIYYRIYRKSDLFLTFFTFNFLIFLMTFLLNQVQMSIGAAFGLFAVFSMLRYRTEGVSAKDMTYLFTVISIGMISAILPGDWRALVVINGAILLGVQLLEGSWIFRREGSRGVLYDRIDLIVPERRADLLADLRRRTGLPVHRVEVQDLDFLKDAAQLTLFYYADAQTTVSVEKEPVPLEK